MTAPSLFQFLTQAEWKLCFSISFLEASDDFTGAYPLERYATPGSEGRADNYGELFRRAIRFLAMAHDYKFMALDVYENGGIIGHYVVQPENASYHVILQGSLPDIDLALETAITLARRKIPSLNIQPLQGMQAKVRGDKSKSEDWKRAADPNGRVDSELTKLREEGMKHVGMVKDREIIH